ncbi:MAG: NERD domain-containing protein [Promethearchaeota archaeon]
MSNIYSFSLIKRFFFNIYKILKETDINITELWCEISEFYSLKEFNKFELIDFLSNFEFIKMKKGNYINYIIINKVLFILESIKYIKVDLKFLSGVLDYQSFETLVQEILLKNNYRTVKNFRFIDKSNFKSKTSQRRYEIDVIGIYQKYILIIDAKRWKRKDSFNSINKAANLQYQRVVALKKNPEIFSNLIHKLLGSNLNIKKRFPFKLIPIIVTLEDNFIKLNNNQIPIVSINIFNDFLQEYQIYSSYYNTIEIKKVNIQKHL